MTKGRLYVSTTTLGVLFFSVVHLVTSASTVGTHTATSLVQSQSTLTPRLYLPHYTAGQVLEHNTLHDNRRHG